MFWRKKDNLNRMVENADNAKKVNPLDLSSDQDLTIAIMNLIKLEQLLGGAGYDAAGAIRDMRHKLMSRIITDRRSDLWRVSQELLGDTMDLIEKGMHQLPDAAAYDSFDSAYEKYSLFWGVNMGLVDVSSVGKSASGKKY